MTDPSGTTVWDYDSRGRVAAETKTIVGTPFTTAYTYRADDQVQSMTYPDGETLTTGYNARGLTESVTGSSNGWDGAPAPVYATAATYNGPGQLTGVTYGNGISTSFGYDPQTYHLTSISVPNVLSLGYGYDAAGNLQSFTDSGQATTYGYDDLNRLQSAQGAYTADYSYSPSGNLLTKKEQGGVTTNLVYPTAGQAHSHSPSSVAGVPFAYDGNGNVTGDGRRILGYDEENRLSQVISGTITTNFAYDGDGKLAKRTAPEGTTLYVGQHLELFLSASTPPPGPGPTPHPGLNYRIYLPLAGQCYLAVNGQTARITKYYYFNGQQIAKRDGCSGQVTYFYRDHLGSTLATSSAGETARYWPYGGTRTGGITSTSYRFTGQDYQGGIGLYRMGARWYDPYLNRWIQPDTIVPDPTNPQSLNRYSFASNNPLRYVDKNGHCGPLTPVCLALLFGAILFGVQDDGNVTPVTQETINSERLGVALFAGGTTVAGASLLGVGGTTAAACADGDCTNEVQSGAQAVQNAAPAMQNAGQAAQSVWRLNPFQRGVVIENMLGRSPQLAQNFPVIDRFQNGVATSIKSIDLGAKSYQNMAALTNQVQGYVNDLSSTRWHKSTSD